MAKIINEAEPFRGFSGGILQAINSGQEKD